jgi:hypothetical protein
MSRLSEWVDMQVRLVQHGGTVAVFRLKGPDDTNYGTWPVGTERLADCIATTASMLSDELPKGRHSFSVHAYDADGGEVAVMPYGVDGRSAGATSAAAEQLTLQKATSAAIFNANVLNEGLRKQVENLNQALAELSSSNVELIDRLQQMAADNAARDIADMRRDAVNDALVAACAAVKTHAEPLLELILMKWGPNPNPELAAAPTPAPATSAAQVSPEPTTPVEPAQPTVTSERAEPAQTSEPINGSTERDPEPDHGHRGDPRHEATRDAVDDRKRPQAGRRNGASSAGKASRATPASRARGRRA